MDIQTKHFGFIKLAHIIDVQNQNVELLDEELKKQREAMAKLEEKFEVRATDVLAAWSETPTYALNDLVMMDGAIYRSLQDGNTGHMAGDAAWWAQYGGSEDTVLPIGKTATPIDDVSLLLRCAGTKPTGAETAESVAASCAKMEFISSNQNALDYLVRCTPSGMIWVSIMESANAMAQICVSEAALKVVFESDDLLSAVLEHELALSELKKVSELIPEMVSNTEPSGIASFTGDSCITPENAYKAFDKNPESVADGNIGLATPLDLSVTYRFPETVMLIAADLMGGTDGGGTLAEGVIEGSIDGINWYVLINFTKDAKRLEGYAIHDAPLVNYIRVRAVETSNNRGFIVKSLQVYGITM